MSSESLDSLNRPTDSAQVGATTSASLRACGVLEVLWTADPRLTLPSRWKYFYRFNASPSAMPSLESLEGLSHAEVIEHTQRSGFAAVVKRQRDLHLQWIGQLDTISQTPIGGRPLREWLRFEGISLWHFLPELCYLSSAAPLQETVELIELLSELIERFRPDRLVLTGSWKDHQKIVVSLISQRYEVPVECRTLEAAAGPVQDKPISICPEDPFRSLEEGQPAAIRHYVSSLRKTGLKPPAADNTVLLLSFPRAWIQKSDGTRVDSYYDSFRPFFQERGFSPVRVEVPYYFQIDGGVKPYIDSVLGVSSEKTPTVFLDEFGCDEIADFARKCQSALQQVFQGWIRDPEFHKAVSWKGISLVSPLLSFWQRTFVDHLALRCIPAMLTARRMLETIRPLAIMAVYEIGIYARAVILEAHRRGIPTLGLQHAIIFSEHEYYLHDDIVHRPDLARDCDGRIVPSKTLLFGPDAQKILTRQDRYPIEATEVLGCDWRRFAQGADASAIRELKATWAPSGRKIVLVISQPSMTFGILHQLIGKLSASEFAVLIKLHPDDKSGDAYRRLLNEHGFEVCLIRDFLWESIQAADVIVGSLYSTAVLESLYFHKRVWAYRELDLGYTVPWESYTVDLATNVSLPLPDWTAGELQSLDALLRELGYDSRVTLDGINRRLHAIFDQLEGKPQRNPIESKIDHPVCQQPVGAQAVSVSDGTETESVRGRPREFRNELYRKSEVHYDNHFQKADHRRPVDAGGSLIHQVQRVSFQLSNLCNYAGVHARCPLHGQTDKRVLPGRVVRDTLDELASIGFDGVVAFHIYNEPMIDPRLFSFIEYARRVCPAARVLILTNGFYLTQTIADELAELGIWNLAVSAYTPAEFDRLSRLQVKVPYKVFEARLDHRLDQYERAPIDLKKSCWAPVRDLSIGPDGGVILCCLDWKYQHSFGNLLGESLSSILNKETIRSAYRDLLGGTRSLHLCRRCDWVR